MELSAHVCDTDYSGNRNPEANKRRKLYNKQRTLKLECVGGGSDTLLLLFNSINIRKE